MAIPLTATLLVKPMTPNFKAHVALFGSSLIFGANYWIAKGLMPLYLTPAQIIFFRLTVTAALFWIASLFIPKEKVAYKDLVRIAYCSLLGVVFNQYFFFMGLRLSNPVETAILHTTSPILVLIFAAWIIKERITIARMTGIFLGAIGAIFIVLNGKTLDFSSEHFLGHFFIILNITTYSLYLVLIKPVMIKYHPLIVMKWIFLFGMITVIPFTFQTAAQVQWDNFTGTVWFSFFYVIIGSTFLAYLLITISLRQLSPAIVGFYIYLQPMIAAIHGIIIQKEKMTMIKILAALLIFTGVYFINQRPKSPFSKKVR